MRLALRPSNLFACLVPMMIAASAPLMGLTPPVMTITYGALSATIDGTGAVTFTGCGSPSCATVSISVSPGDITWSGRLGVLQFTNLQARSKPALPVPSLELSLDKVVAGLNGATFTIQLSDTGFTGLPPITMTALTNSILGTNTGTYQAYVDNTNTLFGTGTLSGSIGPITETGTVNSQNQAVPGTNSTTITGPGPTSPTFSMTEVEQIAVGPFTGDIPAYFGSDFSMAGTPVPPLQLSCSVASGQAGYAYDSSLSASGGYPPYTFSIVNGALPGGLSLDMLTGLISGTPQSSGNFNFTAQVVDSSGISGSNTITTPCGILVTPPPAPPTLACSASTGVLGTPYSSSLVGMGGTPPYTFSIIGMLPSGLFLNGATGAITGTPNVAGPVNFTAQIVDSSNNSESSTVTTGCGIDVYPPVSASCVSINAIQNVPITPVKMAGSGGAGGPYTFSATGLPSGVSMAPDGTISGTPTQTGMFNYSVTVTDSAGNHGTVNCSVTVYPPIGASCVSITAVANVAITPVTMTASGGAGAPYSFSATGLPSGLSMAPNGTVSGTPTQTGTFNYTVTVTDSAGNQSTVHCSVTVNPPATTPLVGGDTATIGFWHNKNGQALIDSLNGGPAATNLGNWLATQFPYLYGPQSGNDLTSKTNQQVAAQFLTFFNGSAPKTQAQIMAGALAFYVTTSSLGGNAASKYGFNVSAGGTGSKTYNVGSNGAAVGLTNNTSYTVLQLLQQVNLTLQNNTFNANAWNDIFNGINTSGDITG